MSEIPKASIYTKKGDLGLTHLVDCTQVPKFHSRVAAYGDLDELNSFIGVLRCQLDSVPALGSSSSVLFRVQNHLFNIGSLLACEDPEWISKLPALEISHIEWLEKQIDLYNHPLPPLKEFILPGGQSAAASAHVARTVCRRAERKVAALAREEKSHPIYKDCLIYLNRLSDFFFTLARWIHLKTGTPEVKWDSKA
jgi:cob(I)alamin adenosyltransferase